MNSITAYIFRQLLSPLAFVTITLAGVIWLTQSLRFIDLIINRGLSGGVFLYLTLLLLPSFLVQILPIATFFSVLFVYYRLDTDSELVVMRGTGLNQWDLLRPALMIGLLATCVVYTLTLYVQPLGFRTFKDKQFAFRHNLAPVLGQEGVFHNIINGITVFIRERGPNGELRGILVHDERNLNRPVTIMAKEGSFVVANDIPRFVLVNGTRQEMNRERKELSMLHFERYTINLGTIATKPSERWREGSERYLNQLFEPGSSPDDIANANKLRAEGHRRLLTPFFALAMAMIAAAGVLSGNNHARKRWVRPLVAGCCAVAFEIVGIGLFSLLSKTPGLTVVVYLYLLLTIATAILVVVRQPNWTQGKLSPRAN